MNDRLSPHLRSALRDQSAEDELGLPDHHGGEYQAHARPTAKPVFALHCLFSDGSVRTFQYCQLDSQSRYRPQLIELRFAGSTISDVAIHGRNLWRLYDYLHQHRLPWLQETVRDLSRDGETVITRITVQTPDTTKL